MSKIEVNTIEPQSGTSLTLGASGDTITIPSGATLDGSNATALTGFASTNGITMAQQWRLTTDFSINSDSPTVIASNWETIDTDDGGSIGSSMSQSSGIFTYPSTGIYNVTFVVQLVSPSAAVRYAGGQIETTANNSSYDTAAANYNAIYFHPTGFGVSTMNFMHDVADVSNDKIRFKAEQYNSGGASTSVKGSTSYNYTYATFVRLGDT